MSQTIDSKIVEMQFDNSKFEKNVATSMSTLDKLKNALKFDGIGDGIKKISSSMSSFNARGMTDAIETVTAKFSYLDVVAITAISNITNSAVNAGKRILASLSVDQIMAGWTKFGQKTSSVATLVAQGYELETVNSQLERLNWFTDETSYNFTDMVENISKFTATGQELEPSVTAMEGIATWAALSGQNATTASRAMYQLSQAMGKGALKYDDFKSIQNASMDTKEFRQHCLDAAVALGTLKQTAEGMYSVVGKENHTFDINRFTEYLSQDAWLTSDVMMNVFTQYSSAVDKIYKYAEEHGITASEAIEELGDDIDSFGKKAFLAAQEARTFTDVIDSVKDAASTSWMNIFELLIGNYEEATKLYTDMANEAYEIFVSPINALYDAIEQARYGPKRSITAEDLLGLNFDEDLDSLIKYLRFVGNEHGVLYSQMGKDTDSFLESLSSGWLTVDIFSDAMERFGESTESINLDNVHNLVKEIIQGKWGGTWEERIEKLKEAGFTDEQIQNARDYVNALRKVNTETWDLSDAALEQVDAQLKLTESLSGLTDEELKNLGFTDEEISRLRERAKALHEVGTPLHDLYEDLENSGDRRTTFINDLISLYNIVKNIGEIIGNAFENTFGIDLGETLSNALDWFHNFVEGLNLEDSDIFNLYDSFVGIFSVLKMVGDTLSTIFAPIIEGSIGDGLSGILGFLPAIASFFTGKILLGGIAAVISLVAPFLPLLIIGLDNIGKFLGRVTSSFGKFAKKVKSAAKESGLLNKIISKIKVPLEKVRAISSKLFDIGGSLVEKVFEKLGDRLPEITEKLSALGEKIENSPLYQKISGAGNTVFESIMGFLENLDIDATADKIVDFIVNFDVHWNNFIDYLKSIPGKIENAATDIINKINWLLFGVSSETESGVEAVEESVGGLASIFDSSEIKETMISNISSLFGDIGKTITDSFFGVEESANDGGKELEEAIVGSIEGMDKTTVTIAATTVLSKGLSSVKVGEIVASSLEKNIEKQNGLVGIFSKIMDKVMPDWRSMSFMDILDEFLSIFMKFNLFRLVSSIIKFLKNSAKIPGQISKVLGSVSKTISSFTKVTKAKAEELQASALLKTIESIALIFGALVAGILILGNMPKDKLDQGMDAVLKLSFLVGAITILAAIIRSLGGYGGSAAETLLSPLKQLAAGITDAMKRFMTVAGIGFMVAGIGAGILMIAIAIQKLIDIEWDKAGDAIKALIAISVGLFIFARGMRNLSIGTAATVLSIALAINLLVPALVTLSFMSWKQMRKGLVAVSTLLIALGLSVRLMGKNVSLKSTLVVLSLAAALTLLIIPIQILGKMDAKKAGQGIEYLSALLIMLGASIRLMGTGTVGGGFLSGPAGASLFVAALALLIYEISKMPVEGATSKMESISALVGVIGAVITALGYAPVTAGLKAAINFIAFFGILSLAIAALEHFGLWDKTLQKGEQIGEFIGKVVYEITKAAAAGLADGFSSLADSLSISDDDKKTIDNGITIIGDFLEKMKELPDSSAFAKLGLGGREYKNIGKFGKDMGSVAGGLTEFAKSFAVIERVGISSTAIDTAKTIMEVLTEIGSKLPDTSYAAKLGLFGREYHDIGDFGAGMAAVGIGLRTYIQSITEISLDDLTGEKIEIAKKAMEVLTDIAPKLPDTSYAAKLGLFGREYHNIGDFGGGMAAVGIGLAAYITSLEGISLDDLTEDKIGIAKTAMEVLTDIAPKLPDTSYAAKLGLFGKEYHDIGDFGTGMAAVGSGLQSYVTSVDESIDLSSEEQGKKLESAKSIINFLAGLVGASTIDENGNTDYSQTLNQMVNYEGLSDFGIGMADLGVGIQSYVTAIGESIDLSGDQSAKFETARSIINFLAGLVGAATIDGNGNTDYSQTLNQMVNYEGLSDFGFGMVAVGVGVKSYISNIGSIKITEDLNDKIETAKNILTFMAGLDKDLKPAVVSNETLGSYIQYETLSDFGKGLGKVGEGLASFESIMTGKKWDKDTVEQVKDVLNFIAVDLDEKLPQKEEANNIFERAIALFEQTKLQEFGDGLEELGEGLSRLVTAAGAIDSDNMDTALNAISTLADIQSLVKETNMVDNISGDTNLGIFGNAIGNLTGYIEDLSEKSKKIAWDELPTSKIKSFVEEMLTIDFTNTDTFKQGLDNLKEVDLSEVISDMLGDEKKLKSGLDTITESLSLGIAANLDLIDLAANELVNSIGTSMSNSIGENGTLFEYGNKISEEIANGISQYDDIPTKVDTFMAKVVIATREYYSRFKNVGKHLSVGLKLGLSDTSVINRIKAAYTTPLNSSLNKVKGYYDKFKTSGTEIANRLHKGLNSMIASISRVFNVPLNSALKSVNGFQNSFLSAGGKLGSKLRYGMNVWWSMISTVFNSAIRTQLSTVEGYIDDFTSAGKGIAEGLESGLNSVADPASTLVSTISTAIKNIKAKGDNPNGSAYKAGQHIGQGLADGMDNKLSAVQAAANRLASAATAAINLAAQVNSPSKVTLKTGMAMGEGLILGMDNSIKSVTVAGTNLGSKAANSFQSAIAKVSDLISNGIDPNPTIRPVLDLSDIRSGVTSIGSMLDMNPALAMSGNLGSISTMMNNRNQNATNDDVVSAINTLNKLIKDTPRSVYNVNGVTYDDGSNVSYAVRELIRYARSEGRA